MASERERSKPTLPPGGGDAFPETNKAILAEAAQGVWEAFLEQYLRPCWREVVVACRQRQIPLEDAEDLYQELLLRLLRDAGFRRQTRRAWMQVAEDCDFRGNLPARFLRYQERTMQSARFRTLLKRVVQNLVMETIRKSRRRPQQWDDSAMAALEPWIEQSVSSQLDGAWLRGSLERACTHLAGVCEAAKTRGRRRFLEILYLAEVKGHNQQAIGRLLGIDRSTASRLLRDARLQLLASVRQTTGLAGSTDLKQLVRDHFAELKAAIALVHSRRSRGNDDGDSE